MKRKCAIKRCTTISNFAQNLITNFIWTVYSFQFAENQEKFFLYLFISVTVGVLLCLTLVIGRLVIQKRQAKADKKSSPKNQSNGGNGDTTIPNGFSDDISEIDGDIDMTTTTLPVPSVSRSEVSLTFALITLIFAYGNIEHN